MIDPIWCPNTSCILRFGLPDTSGLSLRAAARDRPTNEGVIPSADVSSERVRFAPYAPFHPHLESIA
jgi:hypothetical protein